MFNLYPYLNVNDLNLDYILNAIREMKYEVTNFVSINAIKYANPIQWNITSQYEKNTIVIDPVTGTAYISVAPVPSGVSLTRPEYWTVVFDLGSFVTRAAQNFTSRWESETTTTATFSTTMGDWLVWGDVLYRALTNITAGDTYVVDGNIQHFTIEDLYNAYLNTIASILNIIGDLVDLNTADKTSIVNAINEVNNIANTNKTNIGTLANLTTTDKTSIVNAINEANSLANTNKTNIGTLANLTTTDKSNLVNAINEVNANGALVDQFGTINGKTIAIYGDSWVANPSYNSWIDELETACGSTIQRAYGGFLADNQSNNVTNAINDHPYVADIYVVKGGINDWNKSQDFTEVAKGVKSAILALRALNSNAEIYFTTPVSKVFVPAGYVDPVYFPCDAYRQIIWNMCESYNAFVIDGLRIPVRIDNTGFHPNGANECALYGRAVVRSIINRGDSRSFENQYVMTIDPNTNNRTMYTMKGGRLFVQPFASTIAYVNGVFKMDLIGYSLTGNHNIPSARAICDNVGGTKYNGYNRITSANQMQAELTDTTVNGNGLLAQNIYELELFPTAFQHGII